MTKHGKRQRKVAAKTGPEPERVVLSGNWKNNIKKALAKKRPKDGWPKE